MHTDDLSTLKSGQNYNKIPNRSDLIASTPIKFLHIQNHQEAERALVNIVKRHAFRRHRNFSSERSQRLRPHCALPRFPRHAASSCAIRCTGIVGKLLEIAYQTFALLSAA
jgi:hypothetical protein